MRAGNHLVCPRLGRPTTNSLSRLATTTVYTFELVTMANIAVRRALSAATRKATVSGREFSALFAVTEEFPG
jgi:hypothetical protein